MPAAAVNIRIQRRSPRVETRRKYHSFSSINSMNRLLALDAWLDMLRLSALDFLFPLWTWAAEGGHFSLHNWQDVWGPLVHPQSANLQDGWVGNKEETRKGNENKRVVRSDLEGTWSLPKLVRSDKTACATSLLLSWSTGSHISWDLHQTHFIQSTQLARLSVR